MRRRVAVLISGRGSNMAALIAASRNPAYPAEIVLVLSNREDAAGLALARGAQVEAHCVPHRAFGQDRAAHEAAIADAIVRAQAELVCLAGYLRLFTPAFIARFPGQIINIHPSLLPLFPGLNTHRRALDAGVRVHGCTVHVVTDVMDAGPILGQAAVPVLPGDTPEALGARVLVQEHRLYPAVLALAASGTAEFADPAEALCNPCR